jgi:hypothetical protein
MTQEEVAVALEPFTGKRVRKATISAAERSVAAVPERVRHFTVDDLVAYSQIFDLPIQWFLLPLPSTRKPIPGPPTAEHVRAVAGPHWSLTDRMQELSREPGLVARFDELVERDRASFGGQPGDRELDTRVKRAAKERKTKQEQRVRDLRPSVLALAAEGVSELEITRRLDLDSPTVGRILTDDRLREDQEALAAFARQRGES